MAHAGRSRLNTTVSEIGRDEIGSALPIALSFGAKIKDFAQNS
jgi:hypothetical protein